MNGIIALTRVEIVRAVRNRRVLFFSVMFPALLFLLVASQMGASVKVPGTDLSYRTYYLIAYASFGAIAAAVNANAQKISLERKEGWIRQLRLTALPGNGYVISKVVSSLVATVPSLVLVFAIGAASGVHLSASTWILAFIVLWLGALCFTALGIAIGYSVPADSVPLVSTLVFVFGSFLGGQFFALSGTLQNVGKALPMYWVRQLATDEVFGEHLPIGGFAVLVGWILGACALAVAMYRRGLESV